MLPPFRVTEPSPVRAPSWKRGSRQPPHVSSCPARWAIRIRTARATVPCRARAGRGRGRVRAHALRRRAPASHAVRRTIRHPRCSLHARYRPGGAGVAARRCELDVDPEQSKRLRGLAVSHLCTRTTGRGTPARRAARQGKRRRLPDPARDRTCARHAAGVGSVEYWSPNRWGLRDVILYLKIL